MQTNKKAYITVAQLFSMLFISRLVVSITYSGDVVNNTNIWDYIISSVISFVITFILIIPIYRLFSEERSMNVAENSYIMLGRGGSIVISIIYALYYILISTYTLTVFINFVSNVINPPIPAILLSFTLVLASCYGASKGIEGLARASSLILFGIVISGIFIVISLLGSLEKENYTPLLYNGLNSMWSGVMYMISHMSSISAMAMLVDRSKGSLKRGIVMWNTSIYLMIALIIILMVGSLGDFLQTQLFPLYTAVSVAKIGTLRNIDALYLGIWTMGIFVKISMFIMITMDCTTEFVKSKSRGRYSLLIGGAVFILSVCFSKTEIYNIIFSNWCLLLLMLLTSVIIPSLLLYVRKFKVKGMKDKIEV